MKQIERFFPWLLIAPSLLPLVVCGGFIYPYLVPKTLLFYALALITAGTFKLLAAYRVPFYWGRLKKWEAWAPFALVVLAYIASVFGLNFYRSFWSLFVRGDGLLMLTCAVTYFYMVLLYADRAFFVKFVRAVSVIGTIVAVYGIGEWMLGGGRIGSLLGNAGFFAGYLGISFFVTLLAREELQGSWRSIAYWSAGLQLVAILLTATRGTILALAFAGVVALVYLAITQKGSARSISVSVLSAVLVLAVLFFAFKSDLAHVPFAPVARIASIGTSDSDVASRLFVWKNMVGQIAQRPLLGVGAEHIDSLFNAFYDPTQISEQWFDRSHNAFLDYAAQYGIGALVLYLALIGSFFTASYRLMRSGKKREAELFALLAITYAVQNFFIFDTVSSFWLVLSLLALVLALSSGGISRTVFMVPFWSRGVAWVTAGVFLVAIIPVSVMPAMAAYDLSQAYRYQRVNVSKEINYFSHGFALGTYGDLEYGYEAYDMYANEQASNLSGNDRIDAYQAALTVLTKEFNRYPYDARTALYLAHVLSLAPPTISVDGDLLTKALNRATTVSPKRSQPWYILVNLALGDANTHPAGSPERTAGYAQAKDILTRYIALVPTLSEPHFVLAELERADGDMNAASSEAEKGRVNYRENLETSRRAAAYYEGTKDWVNAEFFLGEIVRLVPEDIASLYDLAKVTYLAGDPATADEIVQTLRAKNPEILSTDPNFLNAINAYEQSQH